MEWEGHCLIYPYDRSVILFWGGFMDAFKNLFKAVDFLSVYVHTR